MNVRLLIPAIIIGAVLGLAIGYSTHELSNGMHAEGFFTWIYTDYTGNGHALDALTWMIGGIVVAAAATFLRTGNSN